MYKHESSDSIFYNDSEITNNDDELVLSGSQKRLSRDSTPRTTIYEESSADHIQHAENTMQKLKDGLRSTDGWRIALEHKSGVKVFVKDGLVPGEKVPVFKGEKIIHGFGPKSVFSVVAVRNLWDDWFVEGHLVDNLNDTTSLTYMVMKGFLGSKERDLSLVEKLDQASDGTIYFVSSSVKTPRVPRQPNRTRAVIHLHGLKLEKLIREDGSPSTKLTYVLRADVKGWVPGPVANKLLAQRPLVINAIDDYLQKFGPFGAVSQRISYFNPRSKTKVRRSVVSLSSNSNSFNSDNGTGPGEPLYVHQQFLQRYLQAHRSKMDGGANEEMTDTEETEQVALLNDQIREDGSNQDVSRGNLNVRFERNTPGSDVMFPEGNLKTDAVEESFENQMVEFYLQKHEEMNRRNVREEISRGQNIGEQTSREQLADEAELQRALENAQIQADILQSQIDGKIWNDKDESYFHSMPPSEILGTSSSAGQDVILETPMSLRSHSLRNTPSSSRRTSEAEMVKELEPVSVLYGATSDVVDAYFLESDSGSDDSLRIDDPAELINDEELKQNALAVEYARSAQVTPEVVSIKRDFRPHEVRDMSEIQQAQPLKTPQPMPPVVSKIPLPPFPHHRHSAAVLAAKRSGRTLASTMEGWVFHAEVKGIKLYTREFPGRNMPIVRGDGRIALGYGELNAYTCDALLGTDILAVIRSAAARKVWDDRFERSRQVEYLNDSDILIASEMKGKLTVNPRDLSCVLSSVIDPDTSELWAFGCSVTDPLIPIVPKRVRAHLDVAAWHIVPIAPNYFTVSYVVQIDFKGSVPSTVLKTASKETPLFVGRVESFLGSYGFPPYVLSIQTNRNDGTRGIKQVGEAYYHKPRVYEHCFESMRSKNGEAEVRYRLSSKMYENGAEVSVTGPGRLAALALSDVPLFADCSHGFKVVTVGIGLISVRVSPREGGNGFVVVSRGRNLPIEMSFDDDANSLCTEANHETPRPSPGKAVEDEEDVPVTARTLTSTPPTPVPSSRHAEKDNFEPNQLSKARSVTRVRSKVEPRERPPQSNVRFAVQEEEEEEQQQPQSSASHYPRSSQQPIAKSKSAIKPFKPPKNPVPADCIARQLIRFLLSLNLDGSQLVFVAFTSFASFYMGIFYQRYFV